jgi:hypothetical protein
MDDRGSKSVWGAACVAALCLGGCTFTGKGKGTSITTKVYTEKHHLTFPREPIRSGNVELRLTEAFVEESKTVFEHVGWVTRLRGVVVTSKRLESNSLKEHRFTVIGASGTVYDGYAHGWGPQWQREGGRRYLPPGVSGEFMIQAETQNQASRELDAPVAFTFGGVSVELSR